MDLLYQGDLLALLQLSAVGLHRVNMSCSSLGLEPASQPVPPQQPTVQLVQPLSQVPTSLQKLLQFVWADVAYEPSTVCLVRCIITQLWQ